MAEDFNEIIAPEEGAIPAKQKSKIWIIVIVVLVFICFCCVVVVLGAFWLWDNGDRFFDLFGNVWQLTKNLM